MIGYLAVEMGKAKRALPLRLWSVAGACFESVTATIPDRGLGIFCCAGPSVTLDMA
jgi:hypothetical protein